MHLFASDSKYHGYQRELTSMVFKFFDEKCSESGVDDEPNFPLAKDLQRQNIRKFRRRKVYSLFRDHSWGVGLVDMQSLRKHNKGIKYLLCAIDLFSKYTWVVPLKDKREISTVNAFRKIVLKGRNPSKIWIDQGGAFYNNVFQRFLKTGC